LLQKNLLTDKQILQSKTIDHPTLMIWDEDGNPPQGDWITVLWCAFGENNNPHVISIPKLVEEQADKLKSRYLEWIYKLGETNINGERLVDQLKLREGFSYWWMTLLAEKSNYKSPRLYDSIRLLALEDLIKKLQPLRIILVSSDQTIATILRRYCRKTGIGFEWKQSQQPNYQIPIIKRIYGSLPYSLQAASFLIRYIWKRWPLKQKLDSDNISGASEVTFVDYLIHLNNSAFTTGHFASNYWTQLVNIFNKEKSRVRWLHLYVQHPAIKTPKQASNLLDRFNQNGLGLESHSTLDHALNLSSIFSTFRDYIRLYWYSFRLSRIRYSFLPMNSNLDLWPLFKGDWLNSMRGSNAIWNCLVLNQFEKTLNQIPHQKIGVYLQENQGWEMAYIYAWRFAGHGRLIGVPHSTVRYWDLRYFFDPKCFRRYENNYLPMPDQVALNGPIAMKAFREGGYPEDQVVEVEALRYLYLPENNVLRTQNKDLSTTLKVLVCGDIMPEVNKQMMQWLVSAASEMPPDTRYILKPHPACAIKVSEYPSLKLHLTNALLSELLLECDIAFTSNATSAAVDAYCSGIKVVQVLDGDTFNMSALRGLKDMRYATNYSELAEVLRNTQHHEIVIAQPYFHLDNDLSRWKKLLGLVDFHTNCQ